MKQESFPLSLPDISEMKESLWLKPLIELFNKQSLKIQEQAQVIQAQAEQISVLKEKVRQLEDEINRLKKMPKRPRFRPPGKSKDKNHASSNSAKSILPSHKIPKKNSRKSISASTMFLKVFASKDMPPTQYKS